MCKKKKSKSKINSFLSCVYGLKTSNGWGGNPEYFLKIYLKKKLKKIAGKLFVCYKVVCVQKSVSIALPFVASHILQ